MDTIRLFLRSNSFRSSKRREKIVKKSFSKGIPSAPVECDTHSGSSNEKFSSHCVSSNVDPLQPPPQPPSVSLSSHLSLTLPHLESPSPSSPSTPSLRSSTAMPGATSDPTAPVRSSSPRPVSSIHPSVDVVPSIRGHPPRRRSSLTIDETLRSPCSLPSSFRRTQSHRYSNRTRNYSKGSRDTTEKFKPRLIQVKTHHRLHFESISFIRNAFYSLSLCFLLANQLLHISLARTTESRLGVSPPCVDQRN